MLGFRLACKRAGLHAARIGHRIRAEQLQRPSPTGRPLTGEDRRALRRQVGPQLLPRHAAEELQGLLPPPRPGTGTHGRAPAHYVWRRQ